MQKYEGFFFHQALQGALKGLLEGDGYAIIHDAFYLPESKEKEARKIMQEVKDIMGLCLLSEQELASIEGVSSIQSKELFKFLHG